jgi:hypothetical protein
MSLIGFFTTSSSFDNSTNARLIASVNSSPVVSCRKENEFAYSGVSGKIV